MKLKIKYSKCIKYSVKEAMRIIPQVWLSVTLAFSLAMASHVSAETGPLTIESVECEGNVKTGCSYITAQTKFVEGDPLEDEKVRESQLRLELLGYFEEVDIRLSKGSEIGKTKVIISVKERSSYSGGGSFTGVATRKYSILNTDLIGVNRNLTGHGDSLTLRFRALNLNENGNSYFDENPRSTEIYAARVEYTRSLVSLPRAYFALGLAGGYLNSSAYGEAGNGWGDVALGYKIFDYSFVTAGYRYFLSGSSSSVFFQYGWDSQDNINFPTQGSRFLLAVDSNPYPFFRGANPNALTLGIGLAYVKHWQLAEKHIFSMRLGAGADQNGTDPMFRLVFQPPFAARYSYQFTRHANSSFIENGAVYIEPTFNNPLFTTSWNDFEAGVKIGTVLETKYGMINLSFLGGVL